jgi:beta-lactamase superfamily II metal-dependent hydrolase
MKRLALVFFLTAAGLQAAKGLEVYFIDVEGGQSTLLVTPNGESVLVDAGYPGNNQRDANRIAAAAKLAGVKKIDYLIVSHYHEDHVGGVQQLTWKLPVLNFVDHGPNSETGKAADIRFTEYSAFRDKGHHILAKPGEVLGVKGMEVRVISSNGEVLRTPLAGAGKPNPACQGFAQPPEDKTENGRAIGILVTFGEFRFLDLTDLSGNHEYDLSCPQTTLPKVDAYLTSHHGNSDSSTAPFLAMISPRVAIMNNGARKGGGVEAWQRVRAIPGLEDFWQLHYAVEGGKDRNTGDSLIANLDEQCEGKWLRMTAEKDGSFKIYNSRNKYEHAYGGRGK